MFGNSKPFGTASTFGASSFGNTSTPFGQSTNTFGAKPATSNVFGSSSFGVSTPSAPMSGGLFGSTTPASSTGLFGQPSTAFGTPAATSTERFGFGATANTDGLFGSATPSTQSSGGLFGNMSTSAFGTPRPTFGGFGNTTTGAGLFGQNTSTGSGLFGSSGGFNTTAPTGTTVKFNPPTGTDTMMKGGVSTSIGTRHQCITCMKEYANKSLEELCVEDYAANRKGGSAAGVMGFGTPAQQTSIFGAPAASTSAFSFGGTTQSKPFGSTGTTNTFGSGSLFGQPAQTQNTGLFGKPAGFGTPATSAAPVFNFGGTAGNSLFGQNNQQKPLFGQSTGSTGLFGNPATTQSTGFGGGTGFGAFGNTNQQSDSSKETEVLKSTNPSAQKALLNDSQYKVVLLPTAKIKPKPWSPVPTGKVVLLDGLEDEEPSLGTAAFLPKRSVKKLVLKNLNSSQSSLTLTSSGSHNQSTRTDVSISLKNSDNQQDGSHAQSSRSASPLTINITNKLEGILRIFIFFIILPFCTGSQVTHKRGMISSIEIEIQYKKLSQDMEDLKVLINKSCQPFDRSESLKLFMNIISNIPPTTLIYFALVLNCCVVFIIMLITLYVLIKKIKKKILTNRREKRVRKLLRKKCVVCRFLFVLKSKHTCSKRKEDTSTIENTADSSDNSKLPPCNTCSSFEVIKSDHACKQKKIVDKPFEKGDYDMRKSEEFEKLLSDVQVDSDEEEELISYLVENWNLSSR